MILAVLKHRIVRFLFFGGTAVLVNVLFMMLLVDHLRWETPVLRGLANLAAVELSLLYSFLVYRMFVWNGSEIAFRAGYLSQLILYHGSAGSAILLRSLVVFPVLDFLGLHHLLNTILGALMGCGVNYVLAGKYVFVSEGGLIANKIECESCDSSAQAICRH